MDDNWNPNALIVCPYDEVHVVSVQRFQRHILKCRKNHPEKDTVTCPYNATHIMLREKLRSHLGSCPDQSLDSLEKLILMRAIDPDVTQAQNDETGEVERLMGKIDLPERAWVSPPETEDWDEEASTYQEEKGLGNANKAATKPPVQKKSRAKRTLPKDRSYHSHAGREEHKDASKDGLTTYVRMAGRGFDLNSLGAAQQPGMGRGTMLNRQ